VPDMRRGAVAGAKGEGEPNQPIKKSA